MKIYVLSSLMPDFPNGKTWIMEGAYSTYDIAKARFDKLRAESPNIGMRIESTELDSDTAPVMVEHFNL